MPKLRPTLIGWAALTVSALAAIGVYGYVWIALYSATTWGPGWAIFRDIAGYPFLIGALAGLPAGIVLNGISGNHGRENRIAGIWGGVILLLPIPVTFLGIFPTPY